MECDCLVSGCALIFQLAGWLSLVRTMVTTSTHSPVWGYGVLTISLVGLGMVTLVAAQLQTGCALINGLTVGLWLLALISLPGPTITVDPYAALYAEEAQAG